MARDEDRRVTTTAVDVGTMAGEVLDDRFELVRRIGEGGYGAVFEAVQLSVERTCAVKVLASRLGADELSRERFHVEAKATAELRHPNTVTLFDFGVDDTTGVMFLAMEMLDGPTLEAVVSEHGLLPVRVAVSVLEATASSLQEAHDKGLVHRDIKPHNVICTDSDTLFELDDRSGHVPIKVIDFGIAKTVSAEGESASSGVLAGAGGLTRTGMMVGTPTYMSPEQIRGEDVDGRVDQYALAMTTYWLVTGQTPYAGSTALEVASRHLTEPALPLSSYRPQLQVPPAFEDVLLRALEKDPGDRFERIEEFALACQETLAWSEGEAVARQAATGVKPEDSPDDQLSGESETIRADEVRQTPLDRPRPATDETERTRVVSDDGVSETGQKEASWQSGASVKRSAGAWRGASEVVTSLLVYARWQGVLAVAVVAVLALGVASWWQGSEEPEVAVSQSGDRIAFPDADAKTFDEAEDVISESLWRARLRAFDDGAAPTAVGWLAAKPSADDVVKREEFDADDETPAPDEDKKLKGELTVRMIPWGTLFVDGRRVGHGVRAEVVLSPGRHRVVVRQDEKVARDVTVEIEAGERREVELIL